MALNVSSAIAGSVPLWPLTPPAVSSLPAITAGSGATSSPTTSAEFVTAWETLSGASGGTIDASGLVDCEGTLNVSNGGTAAVVVQGGSFKNLTLTNVENLRFEDMVAVTSPRSESTNLPPNPEITLNGCINVQFVDCTATYDLSNAVKLAYYTDDAGTDTDPVPNGWVNISASWDIVFNRCYVEGYFTAFTINDTGPAGVLELLNTEVKGTQNDSFRGGRWRNVRIEGCYIHDHYPLDYVHPDNQHSDMIQIWALNDQLSDNILIKNNIFKQGSSGGQGIYMNVGGNGQITNVTVENNFMYVAHFHGISFDNGCSGCVATRNTVIKNDEAIITNTFQVRNFTPGIRDGSGGNTLTNNIAPAIQTSAGTISTGNYVITAGAGGTATDAVNHFVNPYAGADATLEDLQMLPESSQFGVAGSALL